MESLVHCLCASWLDVVGDNAMCRVLAGLDGCGRLLVAHLFEGLSHGYCFMGVDVEGAKFGFGCTGHDSLEYIRDVEDGAVVGWVWDVR
jgi:hypothetical protein